MSGPKYIRTLTVLSTPFGIIDAEGLPDHLEQRVKAARWTKNRLPDRRFRDNRTLWDEIQAWSMARYLGESPKVTATP